MIFSGTSPNGKKHFDMVLDGSKTRTTRLSDRYKEGKDYAIQPKRTKEGIKGYRIVIDKKREERCPLPGMVTGGYFRRELISKKDAIKEGGYTPEVFEEVFEKIFPKWDGRKRWAYEFHVIEVRK